MQLHNLIKNLIKRALITADRTDEFGQCSYYGLPKKYQAMYPYGTYAIPKASDKPIALILNVGASESNQVGIENDTKKYPVGGASGDAFLYSPVSGSMFRAQGNGKVAIGNKTTELLQKIVDELSEMSDTLDGIVAHTHTAIGIGIPTSPPLNAAAFTAIKVKVNAIKTLIDALKGTII